MFMNYIIYPEGLRKLQSTNLISRLDKFSEKVSNHERDLPYDLGCIFEDNLVDMINELKEEGYYKHIPKTQLEKYRKVIATVKAFDRSKWTVKKSQEETYKTRNEDFPIITGYWASLLLKQKEFWTPEKFGFETPSELHGTIGTYLKIKSRENFEKYREGYKWETKHNNRTFISEISGDHNGDFRFYRTELTPYETLDIFGNQVHFRPTIDSDRQIISPYNSVETSLLAAILKYVEQENLESKILENKARAFLDEFKKGNHRLGAFADAGYDSFGPSLNFAGFDITPITKIEENQEYSYLTLPTTSHDFYYTLFTNKDKNLVFCSEGKSKERKVVLTLYPAEVDHIIKGLFVQAQKGLGRTSSQQLVGILEYYFSEQFKKDIEDSKKKSR